MDRSRSGGAWSDGLLYAGERERERERLILSFTETISSRNRRIKLTFNLMLDEWRVAVYHITTILSNTPRKNKYIFHIVEVTREPLS